MDAFNVGKSNLISAKALFELANTEIPLQCLIMQYLQQDWHYSLKKTFLQEHMVEL